MISFSLNYLFKTPISKYSHIRTRASNYKFGGGHNPIYNSIVKCIFLGGGETVYHVIQVGLEILTLLSPPSEYLDCRCASPCLAYLKNFTNKD